MKIIRTIHPVGQGAFYSERFIDDDGNHIALVVYDCGAQKRDCKYLDAELSFYFREHKVIDILFISHFDDDHINGIVQLKNLGVKIKTVVVPLIDKNDKWFYICTGGTLAGNAINNPKSFFEANNVIRIKMVEENLSNENGRFSLTGDEQGIDTTIPSGRPISLNAISGYWLYIPFNFQEEKRRQKLIGGLKKGKIFISEAKSKNCKIEDLLHDDDFIKDHYAEINNIYKTVCSDGANRCSLIVYSGAIVETRSSFKHSSMWWLMHQYWYDYYIPNGSNSEGCLYLGDTDLNQGRGRGKILNHLRNALKSYTNRIGTIQLPHHGAIKNYNKSLLTINYNRKLFFASFGSTNKYGHPAYNVIEQIIYNRYAFYGVSERRDSGLIEIIRIWDHK